LKPNFFGDGFGSGDGSGDFDGRGYGSRYGYGDGSKYGSGYGDGSGDGSGDGDGSGNGSGDGDGKIEILIIDQNMDCLPLILGAIVTEEGQQYLEKILRGRDQHERIHSRQKVESCGIVPGTEEI
jgi:hypothetical protein